MKKYLTFWAVVIGATFALAFLLTGCASSGNGALLKTTLVTNAVPTNISVVTPVATVTATEETNSTGEVSVVTVTNTVLQTNTVTATNITVQTNYAPSPVATAVLGAAQTVATITGPFDPFSGWVTLGLTALSGGLAWYAKLKNNQAAIHASTVQTVLNAVQTLTPDVQSAVTAAIHSEAAKAGTSATVYAALQAATQ